MEVTIVYFSQTGNTRKVAKAMAGAFQETGQSAQAVSLKKATPQDLTGGGLVGIGTPRHASQAATPVKEFLRTIPSPDSTPALSRSPGRCISPSAHITGRWRSWERSGA